MNFIQQFERVFSSSAFKATFWVIVAIVLVWGICTYLGGF